MIGSIIGDAIGSIYEFDNIKTKDFELMDSRMEATDDSILTIATADWLMHGGEVAQYYVRYATKYKCPMGGYGSMFKNWVIQACQEGDYSPYNSCGNGSAMRVGPVAWVSEDMAEVLSLARQSAECTHNHPEGIKGAQATAHSIYLARIGKSKEEIRKSIELEYGYDLSMTTQEIRSVYSWAGITPDEGNGGTCQGSVPQAIRAFIDGLDFEDCIRNAVSIGGDSDTIACITGSIAEAYHGVPKEMRQWALEKLNPELRTIVTQFEAIYGGK